MTKRLMAEENMSNLTSASGDQASVSSNQQSSFASPNPNPSKKKRSLPGNPDPEAEVVALSPKSLMATNRFVCEICGKGFQRDQNLQLHRRGHNLPWKLKQRGAGEARKKVYVCPEPSCVHHHPSRALGDLTGIKKHFSRKHGEKKWKCDKCSKKYAVHSDWKAHSKICGTREYRCDCGTLFSRRDSFITHRAFCDALAEESARSIAATPTPNHHLLLSQSAVTAVPEASPLQQSIPQGVQRQHEIFPLMRTDVQAPPWLDFSSGAANSLSLPAPAALLHKPAAPSSPHMSATALLQKAAEMGATLSRPSHFGNMAAPHTSGVGVGVGVGGGGGGGCSLSGLGSSTPSSLKGSVAGPPLLRDHMAIMNSLASFDDAILLNGMLRSRREATHNNIFGSSARSHGSVGEEASGADEGMTRDFLGLQTFSHRDNINIFKLHALDQACMTTASAGAGAATSSYELQQQSKQPWQA